MSIDTDDYPDIETGYYQHEDHVPDHYCQHGNYIGSPYGADILCGWCEDGISYRQMRRWEKARRRREFAHEAEQMDNAFASVMASDVGYSAKVATWFTDYIMNHVLPRYPEWIKREYLTGKRVHR